MTTASSSGCTPRLRSAAPASTGVIALLIVARRIAFCSSGTSISCPLEEGDHQLVVVLGDALDEHLAGLAGRVLE